MLVEYLPPYERAVHLIDRFHFALDRQVRPVPPSQTDDDLLPYFYPMRNPLRFAELRKEDLHDLALLFSIFATGCANDYELPQLNAEGELYAHLGRAALSFHNVIEHASLSAVQTIHVLASYVRIFGDPRSSELAWNMISFGLQIALSVRTLINCFQAKQHNLRSAFKPDWPSYVAC